MCWTGAGGEAQAGDSASYCAGGEKKQETGNTGCRLFGIQLVESCMIEEADGCREENYQPPLISSCIELDSSDRQSQPSNPTTTLGSDLLAASSNPERSYQSRQIRSCTKVQMQGVAVGRAVDLTRLGGYGDLFCRLEEMFDIHGELSASSNSKWQVVFTDDEDDKMLVGDDPWTEFCSMVRKIYIYTYEEAKKLAPRPKLSALAACEEEETGDCVEDDSPHAAQQLTIE